jgi:hypothetical protein
MTAQVLAYRVVVSSCAHAEQHAVSTGKIAASHFRTDALMGACLAAGIRAGRPCAKPSETCA